MAFTSDNSITALKNTKDILTFRDFLSLHPIDTAVEIGTYKGYTSDVIAEYANRVLTFDIRDWGKMHIQSKHIKKVTRFIINEETKKRILDELVFDFAFIDGDHCAASVKTDFDLVKKCKHVLFHDYWYKTDADLPHVKIKYIGYADNDVKIHIKETKEAIDALNLELIQEPPFAYWYGR